MMSRIDQTEAGLDALLAEMRMSAAEPSADLLARVLTDADVVASEQERPAAVRRAVPARRAGFMSALGGWGGLGGMLTATLAGVWIGFSGVAQAAGQAAGLSSVWTTGESAGVVELYPGTGDFQTLVGPEGEG
jgi:hypothetical protein